MIFNQRFGLKDKHSFLSPSKYHWIRYSEEKLDETFLKAMAAKRGTELHELANNAIRLGVKLQGKTTMALYVNDAIGYRMSPEQVLYYSDNCFGTADAIAFRRNLLRIHDLKTGESPTSVDQLLVYAALFCLEYGFRPFDIQYDLRIYQSDDVALFKVDPDDIAHIMSTIKTFDQRIEALKMEETL